MLDGKVAKWLSQAFCPFTSAPVYALSEHVATVCRDLSGNPIDLLDLNAFTGLANLTTLYV